MSVMHYLKNVGSDVLDLNSSLSPSGFRTLVLLFKLPRPWFSHLQDGDAGVSRVRLL